MTEPELTAAERRAREDALFAALDRARGTPGMESEAARLRDELVLTHTGLVHHLARHYRAGGEPAADMVQAGMVGLIAAVDGFDPARGTAFSTYAVAHIRGEMRDHLRAHSWAAKAPRRLKDLYSAVTATTTRLQSEGRSPTVQDIAAELGVEDADVLEAMEAGAARVSASLDKPAGDDEGATMHEALGAADPGMARVELRATIASLLDCLPEDERTAVVGKFLAERTQEQIAAELGTSQAQVSRMIKRALQRLREQADED